MNEVADVLTAVIVVAGILVLTRPGSQGPALLQNATSGFSNILGTATGSTIGGQPAYYGQNLQARVVNFGQGGRSNPYPGRAYGPPGRPAALVGGARGPAALPSRLTTNVAPAPEFLSGGDFGTISYHRGVMVENAARHRFWADGVLGHNDIAWSRPTYLNAAGLRGYVPPTQQPSWTADTIYYAPAPTKPIPAQEKHIGSFTVREEYGSTAYFFNALNVALDYVSQQGLALQGRRWRAQAKTQNPWGNLLSQWGQAPSYGAQTQVLPTAPALATAGAASGMGAY